MRNLLTLIAAALLSTAAHAQVAPLLQGDWVERPPISSQQELLCASWSDTSWHVSFQGGILDARRLGPEERSQTRMQFADGELVGHDVGEWGGQLVWRPTSAPEIQLIAGNTRHVFIWNERVFAAGGLAHLGSSAGYVAELERASGGWSVVQRIDLSGPIYAVDYSSPEDVVLATPDGVHLLDANGVTRRIFESSNWWAQYPNSVLRLENGDILVGMRYSISRLRPTSDGYVETLLVPAGCRTLTNTGSRPMPTCICAAA